MNQDLESKLETCTTLPTMSAVALEVLRLCEADQLELRDMAAVVGRDPALAIKVVRTANSPLFSLRQEVLTINQALYVLGVNVVRTLVLSFSLVSELQDEREGSLARCWNRSVFSAVIARCLCGGKPALKEEAFLAALLQDVGVIVLARVYGKEYEALCGLDDISHAELQAAEIAAFGCDHAEVGAWMLAHWGLPSRIVQLVAGSHLSNSSGDADPAGFLAKCVQHSGPLADLWIAKVSEPAMRLAVTELQNFAGTDTVDLPGIASKTINDLRALAPLFQLTIEDSDLESWIGGLVPAVA